MVAKPLCPLYKYIIKPLDRAYYPELRYALFLDGELICVGDHKELHGTEKDKAHFISDAAVKYAQQQGIIAQKGYSLVIASGVDYGQHVENKGYNVLYLTKFFLKDEMKKIILEAVENAKQSN